MKCKPLPFTKLCECRIENFWSKVQIRSKQECWPWVAAVDASGCGKIRIDKICCTSPRVAWFIVKGVDPFPLDVLHHCDNRACCNTDHLFLGTNADNVADKSRKLRNGRRLTPEQATEIKRLLKLGGLTMRQIAKHFKVSLGSIADIKRGSSWFYA